MLLADYRRVLALRRKDGRLVKVLQFVCASVVALSFVQSARSHELKYRAFLDGANESPMQDTPGFGTALVTFDLDLITMHVDASFADLKQNTTASHIHCCTLNPNVLTAGVATNTPSFTGFPLGVTSGTYDHTFDMTLASSYNPAYITANGGTVGSAFNALLAGIAAEKSYFNIHTSFAPGGEIRGFLHAVPEPGSFLLALFGAIGLFARRRRS
jgi:CHRD domain/PEP-CTERM motif